MERQLEGQSEEIQPKLTKMEQLLRACRGADGMVDLSLPQKKADEIGIRLLGNMLHVLKIQRRHLEKFNGKSIVHLCLPREEFNILVRAHLNEIEQVERYAKDHLLDSIRPIVSKGRSHVKGISSKGAKIIQANLEEFTGIRNRFNFLS